MATHPVVHFEMGGPDATALTNFYGALFGWKIDASNPMNYPVVFGVEGGIGGGLPGQEGAPARVTVYVSTDDIRGTLAKAEQLGGKIAMDVAEARDGAPTLAAFTDPDGNFIGLIQPEPGEQPPPPQGTGDPVTWFEIAGTDGERTRDFYSKLFGWTINADNDMGYGEYHGEGGGIGGGIFGGMGDPRVTVYATVDDLGAKLKKANELGATTQMEPMAVPGGPTIAMFADPAGNSVGMILKGSGGA
jgi:predicted enzyme related to lactoylglutathione lyase